MKPESPKANNFVRNTGMPMPAAPISLSRTAIKRRATPLSRHSRTAKIDKNNMARENQAKGLLRLERFNPRSFGFATTVGCRVGNPVQSVLSISGRVTHGVDTTVTCIKIAKAQRR